MRSEAKRSSDREMQKESKTIRISSSPFGFMYVQKQKEAMQKEATKPSKIQ